MDSHANWNWKQRQQPVTARHPLGHEAQRELARREGRKIHELHPGRLADAETAVGAVRAAVSGRLVLSRLAVRSPAAAPERLFDLGAERGPVTATLSCVVAQRLVRRICPDCRAQ